MLLNSNVNCVEIHFFSLFSDSIVIFCIVFLLSCHHTSDIQAVYFTVHPSPRSLLSGSTLISSVISLLRSASIRLWAETSAS